MYKVKLIKNSEYGKMGKYMNPMDRDSYISLYNAGLIEDEHNLIKDKTEKKAKDKTEKKAKDKTEKKDSKNKDINLKIDNHGDN
tara:strand:- start:16598 stop:16849 length:252 start_codon:yes stop_codon:yes gene_type:complete